MSARGEKVSPQSMPQAKYIGLDDVASNTGEILNTQNAGSFRSKSSKFKAGDLLYGRLRPYLNKVTRPDFDGLASAEFIVFPPREAIEPDFLQRVLMAPEFLTFTELVSTGDRPRVSYESISSFKLALPPAVEQKRIVAKLDSLSARSRRARADLDAIPRLIDRYKQAILAAAFQPVASDIDEWTETTLGQILDEGPSNGWSPKSGDDAEGALTLKLSATTTGELDLSKRTIKRIYETPPEDSKFWLLPGDLLIQRANSLEYVGTSAIYDGPAKTYIYPDLMMRVRFKSAELRRLIWRYLNSTKARDYFKGNATGTAGNMPKINGKVLKALPIPLPPEEHWSDINSRIETAFAAIDRLAAEHAGASTLLDRLDQSILARAFRGELVPQDPDDEPASVLLERIRAIRAAAPKPARGRRKKAGG